MTHFVVFTGPSASGKTTAAQLMVEALRARGKPTASESFETPMRRYLAALLGRPGTRMDDRIRPLLGKTPREFMQLEGQHMRFSYGPGVLGTLLSCRVSLSCTYVVIDDGHNIGDLHALGNYTLVLIRRDKVERVYPFELPSPDYYILNSGTIEDLSERVSKLATEIVS